MTAVIIEREREAGERFRSKGDELLWWASGCPRILTAVCPRKKSRKTWYPLKKKRGELKKFIFIPAVGSSIQRLRLCV